MIGIPFLKHFHQKKIVEKNVWFFSPDFREVILKVFPGSKRAEIATIRFVGPELSRLYFLGAKKSSKFIEIWHFQNWSFLSISLTKNLKKKIFFTKIFFEKYLLDGKICDVFKGIFKALSNSYAENEQISFFGLLRHFLGGSACQKFLKFWGQVY